VDGSGLRATLRFTTRASSFVLVALLGFPLLLLGRMCLLPLGGARRRFTTAFFGYWTRIALRVLHVRVRRTGAVPDKPFLLVCNHLSYLDAVVLASCLPCVFLSKAEVRHWPAWGRLCSALGTLYIDQARHRDIPRVMREIEEALARSQGVVFFPEGKSSNGVTVGPFKSPLLEVPVRLGYPVHYATLGYHAPEGEPAAADSVCFWGTQSLGHHAKTFLRLTEIQATLHIGPEPILETDRKRLAERLREGILEKLEPMGGVRAEFRRA
jgi:1-acyl-sn-glycerol-3-phosphate acyltransferase